MHAAGWLLLTCLAVAAAWTGAEAAAGRDLRGRLKGRLVAALFWMGLGLSMVTWLARLAGGRGPV